MKKNTNISLDDGLRPEYDFGELAKPTRGKYAERHREGTNVVLLEPDVAKAYPTDESVNEALRRHIRCVSPEGDAHDARSN